MTIPVIRVRTKTPKVRTGCKTCKARRVRCDEAKPTCTRCAKARRECAGYEANISVPKDRPEVRNLRASAYPSLGSLDDPMACLSTLPAHLETEQIQALQYFTTRVAQRLSGHISANLYEGLLLQVGHKQEAVQHACLAVSFMHRAHATKSRRTLHIDQDSLSHQDMHEVYALQQYAKTVSSLRNMIESSNYRVETSIIETVLLICLLCVHFSLLRGSSDEAFTHLNKGLAMIFSLSRPYATTRGARFRPLTIPTTSTKPIEILLQEFVRLDNDFASWTTQEPYLSPELDPDNVDTNGVNRIHFTSLAEANIILATLSSSVTRHHGALLRYTTSEHDDLGLEFKDDAHRAAHIRASSREVNHAMLTHTQNRTSKALSTWSSILETLPHEESGRQAYLKLRLQFFNTWFLNSTYNCTHESITDNFETTFAQVIEIAEQYLHAYNTNFRNEEAATFDPTPAAIPALFIVAMKCRTPSIRRKAIAVLRSTTLQEGLWHGAPLAILAEKLADVEEMRTRKLDPIPLLSKGATELKCADVPEAARFSDVVFVLDDERERSGRLVCARTDHDHVANGGGDGGGGVVTEEYKFDVG